MRFVMYATFFNPLVILGVDFLAWYQFGWTTLAAVLALPVVVWMTMQDDKLPHKGLWNYLAGLQTFLASVVGGAWVIIEGVGVNNEYLIGLGVVLLLPALVIASLVALSG